MPAKITLAIALPVILLAASFTPLTSYAESNKTEEEQAKHLSATDSANALFDEIVGKYSDDSSSQGQYNCARAYLKLCNIYYRNEYYTNAFSAAANALRIAESNGFDDLLAPAYNSVGKIYCTWRDFPLGTEYFKKGIEHSSPKKYPGIFKSLIINIQGAYINMHKPSLAKPYYEKMKGLAKPDSIVDYFTILNKGLFLLEEGHRQEAIPCFRKAGEIASRHKFDAAMLCSTFDYIGDAFTGSDNDSATFYWNKAVTTPGIPAYQRLTIFKKLSDTHKAMKQRDKAVFYGNQYIMLSDSIFEVSDINRMKDIQIAYENEKKMRTINTLYAEKRARDIKLSNQRKFIVAALCVILIFIIMSATLYRQKRRLQQAYHDLFSRNKEAMEFQALGEAREIMLRDKIASLEQTLKENKSVDANNSCAVESREHIDLPQKKETKTQSVDRLPEEKRIDILTSIENVMKIEGVICDPEFSIEMLADLTGYNSRYVSHVINETYSCNFRTLLNNKRMDIARVRIMDVKNYGNLTIQAIAASLGYKSNSGFVQLFRKHTGVTPSMFQKMAREQTGADSAAGQH